MAVAHGNPTFAQIPFFLLGLFISRGLLCLGLCSCHIYIYMCVSKDMYIYLILVNINIQHILVKIFCLVVPSTAIRRVLKSTALTVELPVSPFSLSVLASCIWDCF